MYSVAFVCALHCKILPLINTAIVLEEDPEFLLPSRTDGRQSVATKVLTESLIRRFTESVWMEILRGGGQCGAFCWVS